MYLIVGLGNPGPEYQFTPHNAGFLALDRIAESTGATISNRRGKALTARVTLAGQEVLLAKPETFMNLSGLSVAGLLRELELTPANLIVIYDELDFPIGQIQIKVQGSANGHNGIKSILASLGTPDWTRVRIGVGRAGESGQVKRGGGADFLLSPMRKMQLQELDLVLDDVRRAVEMILKEGAPRAMNEFNRKANGQPESPAS